MKYFGRDIKEKYKWRFNITGDFWFYSLIDMCILFVGIHTAIQYKKYHRNDDLVVIIISVIALIAIILACFYPASEWLHVGDEVKIILFVAFILILLVSLFYRDIKSIFLINEKLKKLRVNLLFSVRRETRIL